MTAEAAVAGGWIVVAVDDGVVTDVSEPDPTGTFVTGAAVPAHVDVPPPPAPRALGEAVPVQSGDDAVLVRMAGRGDQPSVLLVQPLAVDDPALLSLTPRQRQVLAALADGCTNAQIARRLGIAPSTVKKHLEHIFAILDVDNRVAAVARLSA